MRGTKCPLDFFCAMYYHNRDEKIHVCFYNHNYDPFGGVISICGFCRARYNQIIL